MKPICIINAPLSEYTLSTLCNIMHNRCELITSASTNLTELLSDASVLENIEIYIGNPSMSTLPQMTNLKWLQLVSSGADSYAKSGLIDKNKTALTNATGAYGHAIAEYMVAGVMSVTKKFHLYRDNQPAGCWHDFGFSKTIRSSKVLVVGLGDIGGQFAEKMAALGCEIHAIKRTVSDVPTYVKSISSLNKLNELLPEMDIVALCLPNSPATQNVIDAEQLQLMKNDAILINVGRGNAVNTDALTKALQENIIGNAILDVTDPEPLPNDHPLWKCKNAVITPHISGGYHAQETIEGIENIILENARRYVDGAELINQVDFETGYKKK